MGYYSQAAFVIKFDTKDNAASYLEMAKSSMPLIIDYLQNIRITADGYIVAEFEYIKWYGSCEYIQALTKLYENSTGATGYQWYLFKRIGEDDTDYEEDCNEADGCEYVWETIDFIRSLIINVH